MRLLFVFVVSPLCFLGPVAAASGFAEEPSGTHSGLLFEESFEDANLLPRGWYDGQRFRISEEAYHGAGCLEYAWKAQGTTPESTSGLRRLFAPSDSVFRGVAESCEAKHEVCV